MDHCLQAVLTPGCQESTQKIHNCLLFHMHLVLGSHVKWNMEKRSFEVSQGKKLAVWASAARGLAPTICPQGNTGMCAAPECFQWFPFCGWVFFKNFLQLSDLLNLQILDGLSGKKFKSVGVWWCSAHLQANHSLCLWILLLNADKGQVWVSHLQHVHSPERREGPNQFSPQNATFLPYFTIARHWDEIIADRVFCFRYKTKMATHRILMGKFLSYSSNFFSGILCDFLLVMAFSWETQWIDELNWHKTQV